MTNLLVTLLGGITLIVISFLMLYKFSRYSGKASAVIMAFVVTGIYVPVSIFSWPGGDVFAIHIALYLVTVYLLGIVSSQRDAQFRNGEKVSGLHWGPASIVTFFVLLITADSFFIMFAQNGMNNQFVKWLLPAPVSGGKVSSHFPGTVSHDYHEKEDQYNEYLERFNKQSLLGWKVRKGWLTPPAVKKPSLFRVEVSDKDTKPLTGATVTGAFMRPANSKLDQKFNLQQVEPGIYQASIELTKPGNWNLVLIIVKGNDKYEIRATTSVKEEINTGK